MLSSPSSGDLLRDDLPARVFTRGDLREHLLEYRHKRGGGGGGGGGGRDRDSFKFRVEAREQQKGWGEN